MEQQLTVPMLRLEAGRFAEIESVHDEPTLFGVTDGKAIGMYFEHKFRGYLSGRYRYDEGSSASEIDFPGLDVDMKSPASRSRSLHVRSSRRARKYTAWATRYWSLSMRKPTILQAKPGG